MKTVSATAPAVPTTEAEEDVQRQAYMGERNVSSSENEGGVSHFNKRNAPR